jgi:membrane protease YdiL (CAAX protease family)
MVAGAEALGLAGLAAGIRRPGRSLAALGLWKPASLLDYAIGCALAFAYCAFAWRQPSVEAWAFEVSALKAIALVAAVVAGVFEELFFRGFLMDLLKRRGRGASVQVGVSGLAFGLAHAVWGLGHPNAETFLQPILWTSALGIGLAALYLKSGRALGPVIVSHILIDAVIEPGLLMSYFG